MSALKPVVLRDLSVSFRDRTALTGVDQVGAHVVEQDPVVAGEQDDAGEGGAVTERDGDVAEDDGWEPRNDRHAAVLTKKRDSPGAGKSGCRGRESGQAEIHMMHPAYVELRLVIH